MTSNAPTENTIDLLDNKCRQLDELLKDKVDKTIMETVNQLNAYYIKRFMAARSNSAKKDLLEEYQFLLDTIREVLAGESTAEEAIASVKLLASNRKLETVLNNVLKACELLFWVSAALTSYAFCLGLGIPLVFLNPVFGLAITLGTCVLMIHASMQAINCFGEFNSFREISAQEEAEQKTLSLFFTTPKPNKDDEMHEDGYDAHYGAHCSV